VRSTGITAHASVGAERVGERTRCTTLRSSPPISLRTTPDGLYLASSAAGPIGGDDLRLDVDVAAGADLDIRTVAAGLVHPSAHGHSSRLDVHVTVAGGATLRWLPEPTVLVQGCDHRTVSTIRLAAGASLVWRDEVVLGRHDEPSGSLLQRLRIDVAGRPLLRSDLALGPAWPGADGPAGVGHARAVGTLVAVGGAVAAAMSCTAAPVVSVDGARLGICPLSDGAVLVTAVGDRPSAVRQALAQAMPQ
jgi:urease accessory protein